MENNPILYSDLVKPDSSITDLIEQLNELIATYEQARSKIVSEAAQMQKSMEGVSGATEEQREQIKLVTTQSDKLVASLESLDNELLKAKRAQAEANEANREASMYAKLITQLNNSAEGSYNRLSAQYRLNKIALNEMSEAQRKGTEAGRQLEKETAAIYAKMNEMQKATGKFTLQVGNYERALGGMVGVNNNLLSVLTDSTKAHETFKGILNTLKTPVGAAIGVIGGLTAAFKLWRASINSTQDTGDEFNRRMAGWKNVWEQFKVAVAEVDFSNFINSAIDAYTAGANLRDVLDEVFEITNSLTLQRAELGQENEELLETMRDQTKTYQARVDAGKKYLANVAPLYQQESDMLKTVRDAQAKNLWARVKNRAIEKGVTQEQFFESIKSYSANMTLVRAAKAYNNELDSLAQTQKDYLRLAGMQRDAAAKTEFLDRAVAAERAQKKLIQTTGDGVKQFAAFLRVYGITNDETVKAYVEAEAKYTNSLSAYARENRRINTQIHSLEAQMDKESRARRKKKSDEEKAAAAQREKDEKEADEKIIKNKRESLKLTLANLQEQIKLERAGTQEWLALRLQMIEQAKEIELFENSQKTEELKQDELAIREKYDAMILREEADFYTKLAQQSLNDEQKLAEARFNQLNNNERQITEFRMMQERQRLLKILEIDKTAAVKMTDAQRQVIKETIKALEKEAQELPYNNLYELLGLDVSSGQQSALNTAIDSIKSSVDSLADSWVKAAEAATQAADEQVAAAQKALEAEIEAQKEGYANNVEMARRNLEAAQANREKALEEEKKAKDAQLLMDSLEQSSSLITATANIWKAWGKNPILAGVITATMWSSFIAAKVKAAQVTKYAEGGVELLEGGSHASGHDIDLGMMKNGRRRRAEGGEYLAIVNKRNSRKYGAIIPSVINAFNDGTFEKQYQKAGEIVANTVQYVGADITNLEKEVTRIRKQGDERRSFESGMVVMRYKNLTRKIKS